MPRKYLDEKKIHSYDPVTIASSFYGQLYIQTSQESQARSNATANATPPHYLIPNVLKWQSHCIPSFRVVLMGVLCVQRGLMPVN